MTLALSFRFDADSAALQAAVKGARNDLDQLTTAVNAAGAAGTKAGDGLERARRGADQVGGGAADAANDVQRLAREFDAMKSVVDPAEAALKRFQQQQLLANQAVAAGVVSQAEASRVVGQAAQRYQAATRTSVAGSRSAGAAAQQFGYQIGDLAVQVASGQNAVVALTQQGTQLLQAFGPWGSIIGAAAAIVGVAAVSLLDFEDAAEKAEKAQTALRDSLSATKDLIGDTADDIRELADRYNVASEAQRKLIDAEVATRIADNVAKVRQQIDALRDLAFDDVSFDTPIDDAGLQDAFISVAALADTFKLTTAEARRLQDALFQFDADPTTESAQRLTEVLAELSATSDGDKKALLELTTAAVEISRTLADATTETDRLRQAQRLLGGETVALTQTQRDQARELQRQREEGRRLERQRAERIGELQLELRQLSALTLAHGEGRQAVEQANAANAAAAEHSKLKVKADSEHGRVLTDLIAKIQEKRKAEAATESIAGLQRELGVQQRLTDAQRLGGRAIADAADARKAYQEIIRIGLATTSEEAEEITRLITRIEEEGRARQQLAEIRSIEEEIGHLQDLAVAHQLGAEAIARVNAEQKIRLTLAKLNLDADSEQGRQLTELIRQLEQQRLATQRVEEAAGAYREIWSNAVEDVQKFLTDQVEDALAGNLDSVEAWGDSILSIVRRLAASLISQALVIPLVVGGADAIGLGSFVPPAYRTAAQSSPLGGFNPLSLLNSGGTGGLYNGFAMSGIGQSLGLSYGAGTLATNAGLFAAGSGALGTFAAGGPAALALTGPAGGFGTIAGLTTASTGGAVGAATAGGALGASGGLTGLGAGLGAAMPYIGIGLAALSILGPSLFGGGPTVGPVGIADFSPGLGRGREFDDRGVDPFTGDNGGDGETMRPIAEAIAELIADSADRFGATIDGSLRFRIANYASPEGGSGRQQGFEVNAFLQSETERRIAEGKTQEQAIKEALEFAIKEAFAFDRQVLEDVSQTISGDTADELLGQLQAALDFDDLTTALHDHGEAITANTLAVQEQILALQRQGEERGRTAADATLGRFETFADLFAAPEALAGRGRTATPQPIADTSALDGLRAAAPEFDRGAWRGLPPGVTVLPVESENGSVLDPGGIQVGDDVYRTRFDPGLGRDGRLELVAPDGEVIGAFDTLGEAIAGAAEAAATAAATLPAADQATEELYDRNLGRIRDAIQITRADVDRDIGRITGEFEEPKIGVNGARYIEGQAALDAYGEQLDEVNEAFRRQAQDFPELAAELNDFLIDIPATLAAARDELRQQEAQRMTDDLDVEDRQLRGAGAVDGIRDLVDLRDTRLTDAATLGVDATLVNRNFRVAVEKAFDGLDIDVIREIKANVTDPVVRALADQEIAERVTDFNRSIGDQLLALEAPQTAQLVQLNRQYQSDLEFANDNGGDTDALMRLYQEQARRLVEGTDDVASALTDTVSAFTRVLPDLRRFRSQLDTDATLSTLTTEERYALLKADFAELKTDAEGGDVEAQAQLEEAGRELLAVSRLVNAANDNYEADRKVVMAAVDASIAKADTELQLARDQLNALNGIDARLAELADALSSGQLGGQPTSNLILAQASGFSGSFGNGGFGQAAQAYGASRVQGLGHRPELNAQLAYVTGFTGAFGGGGSGPSFQEYVRSSAVSEIQREAARIILRQNGETPGFVDGGYVLNGTPGVDSVTAKLAGREFVVRSPAVAQLGVPALSYINETGRLPGSSVAGDAGVAAELRAIIAELRQQGDASRLQSRDDADHVAGQVGRLHGALAPAAAREAHERARPGRAAA